MPKNNSSKEEQEIIFDVQEDGWPNAGQVMRFFRERSGITAKAFGKLYGSAIKKDGKPICERWILEMELENRVPSDITRRRIIANLLCIPPALLGLGELNNLLRKEHSYSLQKTYSVNAEKSGIVLCKRNICDALYLHLTNNANLVSSDIKFDRLRLELLINMTQESSLLCEIKEVLIANDLLSAKIATDQMCYIDAYNYANHALFVAESIKDNELLATAYYTRGCIQLQWGQFGQMREKSFQLDKNKVKDAIQDLQNVLHLEEAQHISLHPQLHGYVFLQLSRAQALLHKRKQGPEITNVLRLVDKVADTVERDTVDDLYTRMILTGTVSGLHLGGYYLTRADIFNAAGLPDDALIELNRFKYLTERVYGKNETRNHAWHNIVLAKTLMSLKEYPEAARNAKDALIACLAINSLQNIAIIWSLYLELKTSPYREASLVKEMEEMLVE